MTFTRARARFRTAPDRQNKTERRFMDQYLLLRKFEGVSVHYEPCQVKYRLADKTWFLPDFAEILADGEINYYDVKAAWKNKDGSYSPHCEDDAKVKIKVAAEQHRRWGHWIMAWEDGRAGCGAWKTKEFNE